MNDFDTLAKRVRALSRALEGIVDEVAELVRVVNATKRLKQKTAPRTRMPQDPVVYYEQAAAMQEAIRNVGSLRAMAEHLGVSHQAVSAWARCPAERVLLVEQASGVSRQRLRPDLFQ